MTTRRTDVIDERDWIRAFVVLAALAAIVLFLAVAFALPALTCGCTEPAPGFTPLP